MKRLVLQFFFVNVCARMLRVVSVCVPGMVLPCMPALVGACVIPWHPPPPPIRCSPRPLVSAADAAELPGRAQRGREGPGVAERRLPHEPGAELQLACRAGRHDRERERTGALVPRSPRYTQCHHEGVCTSC